MSSATNNVNDRDANGYAKLHRASLKGDLAEIKRLLAAGANVNCRTFGRNSDRTALHIASQMGHLDVVRFLLDNCGVQIDSQDDEG